MNVIVNVSTINDGNMLNVNNPTDRQVLMNRASFLGKNKIELNQATCINVTYGGKDYKRYFELTDIHLGKGMSQDDIIPADALVTKSLNHALFMPIADCVGAVIFDPDNNILMLSHLGRHSLEQEGGKESINFFIKYYKSNPKSLKVWLTPSPGPDKYPMYKFQGSSIRNTVFQQFQSAGVLPGNIIENLADTTKDERYFSHSEFLKGNQKEDGRYAVIAMMTE